MATLVAVAATGCAAPVDVGVPDAVPATDSTCSAIVDAVPAQVAGSAQRATTDARRARAWGEPPITLRCGVAKPTGLTSAAQCLEINDVGWWRQQGHGGTVWTTIGREVFVEVAIPSEFGNPADVLADLSTPVAEHNRLITPCAG